jgi:isoleucyl-tRNA synthetase
MKFDEVKQISFPGLEVEILNWWKEHEVFEKSTTTREEGLPFTFYEGPPTANGKPGIHHVMARTIKDLFCRYRTLKGYKVERKAGWDTHGLPVEIEVEKELGLKSRQEIEEYGIAEYNQKCRESVLKYTSLWNKLTDRMGYWVDLEDPYITYEDRYIESIWWALKQLNTKGYLYKGHKIAWYSPGSGTVLSSHEVSLGYKEVQDPSVYVFFPLTADPEVAFMAWTTTPWTLVSNMALVVNRELTYVKVKLPESEKAGAGQQIQPRFAILAEACVGRVFQEEVKIVNRYTGNQLEGWEYAPAYRFAESEVDVSDAWKVTYGEYVTTEDGTGVVHTAPAFGADDYETCQRLGVPLFNPVDKDGRFTEKVPLVEGEWFKDADKIISRDLKERGYMFRQETIEHNYPFDWRKATPLISYPVDSWFIRTTAVREKLLEYNDQINWKPESTGTGRFGTWLQNNVDWAISRQRYWGTPIPIWVSDQDPERFEVIGSLDELRRKAGLDKDDEIDMHRPGIDEITWETEDGHLMRRIPDLLDVWFDSGAMPFAQWHYPFENKERFERAFPADFIAEGVDQTRGWFYTLHALATLLFDEPAFKNVISNGLVLDEKGEKMSKSKGNTVDPFQVIQQYGADTVRWYMISNSSPWENIRFSDAGLQETQRKVFNTVTNAYSFFATYANIDEFTYSGQPIDKANRHELDRWVISRLNQLITQVDEFLEAYEPTRAAREIEEFIEDLSNWYIRRSRRRFWDSGSSLDKTSAYQTLYETLAGLAKLMSPIAPFFSEWLHQRLNNVTGKDEPSVHLAYFPTVEETAIDARLERQMKLARDISSMVLRSRNKVNINVRQPLSRIIIPADKTNREDILAFEAIVRDEVNVKTIEFVDDDSEIVYKNAKPVFPVLGKKVGKDMKEIANMISNMDLKAINSLERQGALDITLSDGRPYRLLDEDVEIIRTGLEGWSVESEDGLSVALDTDVSESLRMEGLAREFVNRIQNMRKESAYDVTDQIRIGFETEDEFLRSSILERKDYVASETLAEDLQSEILDDPDFTKEWEIGDSTCIISIIRQT